MNAKLQGLKGKRLMRAKNEMKRSPKAAKKLNRGAARRRMTGWTGASPTTPKHEVEACKEAKRNTETSTSKLNQVEDIMSNVHDIDIDSMIAKAVEERVQALVAERIEQAMANAMSQEVEEADEVAEQVMQDRRDAEQLLAKVEAEEEAPSAGNQLLDCGHFLMDVKTSVFVKNRWWEPGQASHMVKLTGEIEGTLRDEKGNLPEPIDMSVRVKNGHEVEVVARVIDCGNNRYAGDIDRFFGIEQGPHFAVCAIVMNSYALANRRNLEVAQARCAA